MICKNVRISAPGERCSFLKNIHSVDNTCVYQEKDGSIILTIDLCNKLSGTRKQVKRALHSHEPFLLRCFAEMMDTCVIDRYVLEDSQVILHIWQGGKPEFSMLLQDRSIEWEDKNWREPFLPYWEK